MKTAKSPRVPMLAIGILGGLIAGSGQSATRVWTGGGADSLASTAAN